MSELILYTLLVGLPSLWLGWALRGVSQSPVTTVCLPGLSRRERVEQVDLFGHCELCSDPAVARIAQVDELGGEQAILLCREHFVEAVAYHTQDQL